MSCLKVRSCPWSVLFFSSKSEVSESKIRCGSGAFLEWDSQHLTCRIDGNKSQKVILEGKICMVFIPGVFTVLPSTFLFLDMLSDHV